LNGSACADALHVLLIPAHSRPKDAVLSRAYAGIQSLARKKPHAPLAWAGAERHKHRGGEE